MSCEKCDEPIDERLDRLVEITIDNKNIMICRECYEDYWDEQDKK